MSVRVHLESFCGLRHLGRFKCRRLLAGDGPSESGPSLELLVSKDAFLSRSTFCKYLSSFHGENEGVKCRSMRTYLHSEWKENSLQPQIVQNKGSF